MATGTAQGDSFAWGDSSSLASAWTAALLGGALESLGSEWANSYPSFRIRGTLYPVTSYLVLDQSGAPVPKVLILLPMSQSVPFGYLTFTLAAALLALSSSDEQAAVYVQTDVGYAAVRKIRQFYTPLDHMPYALEISSDPLIASPVVAQP